MMNKPRKLNIRYNWTDKQFKAFNIFMGVSITLFILAMTLMCIFYGKNVEKILRMCIKCDKITITIEKIKMGEIRQ